MSPEDPKDLDDLYDILELVNSLEKTANYWHEQMVGAQIDTQNYSVEGFVKDTLQQEVNIYKRKWWDTLELLKQVKKKAGMEWNY